MTRRGTHTARPGPTPPQVSEVHETVVGLRKRFGAARGEGGDDAGGKDDEERVEWGHEVRSGDEELSRTPLRSSRLGPALAPAPTLPLTRV